MATIKKALSKVMDKFDKSRTINTDAVERMKANNKVITSTNQSSSVQKDQQNR